jgi:hypothetical protein
MNAKEELLETINGKAKINCAIVEERDFIGDHLIHSAKLRSNYSQQDFEDFLKALDFDYDAGYGGQELFGTVWLDDGTWLERGEYDGSEWWEHKVTPEIPAELL